MSYILISGNLVNQSGVSQAGARIIIAAQRNSSQAFTGMTVSQITGASGEYAFNLSEGYYRVMVSYENNSRVNIIGDMKLESGSEPGTLNDYVLFAEPVLAVPTVYAQLKLWYESARSISADVTGQVALATDAAQQSQEHASQSLASADFASSAAQQASEALTTTIAAKSEVEAAKDVAVSASDAARSAAATAGLVPDIATGLANTQTGQSFSVAQGSGASTAIITYRNDNGVAVETSRLAGQALVEAVKATADYAKAFNDKLDDSMSAQLLEDENQRRTVLLSDCQLRILLSLHHEDRKLKVYGRPITSVDDLDEASGDRYRYDDIVSGKIVLLADSAGRVLLALDYKKKALSVFGSDISHGGSETFLPEMADLPSYGQSLSVSWLGTPGLTTPMSNAYFFSGNMKTYGRTLSSLSVLSATTVVEYHEKSMVHQLNAMTSNPDQCFLVSASGVEGYSMAQLEPGTEPWRQFMARIDKARELSNAINKQYGMVALTFFQGEADAVKGSSYDYYREKMRIIQSATSDKARAVSGQQNPVPMFIYQMASHGRYAGTTEHPSSEIPLAQLDEAIENPLIQLITPMYIFPYTDGVHLTNHGYRWLGCYRAKAVKHWLETGEPWRPVYPMAIYKSGQSTVVADFHTLPSRTLQFRTDVVTPATDGMGGFELWGEDESGVRTRLVISSVSITGQRKVKVIGVEPFTGYSKVYLAYAFTPENRGDNDGAGRYPSWNAGPSSGVRGNLCDDDDATTNLLNADGVPYPLHNYCAIFFKEAI